MGGGSQGQITWAHRAGDNGCPHKVVVPGASTGMVASASPASEHAAFTTAANHHPSIRDAGDDGSLPHHTCTRKQGRVVEVLRGLVVVRSDRDVVQPRQQHHLP